MKIRLLALPLLVLLVWAFLALDLQQLLTLPGLKSGMGRLNGWREESPVLMALGFAGAYLLVAVLSLPASALMSLAAGALFGLFWGTLIASFASSIGATLAFWIARHLLRERLQARFGHRLRRVNNGMARDGAYYLFSLRVVPVMPFFLVNLLMGLTPIRARTFYWVSQLGMLPSALVYINAGTQLARIRSPSEVFSPSVMLSFALLGLFPLMAKILADRLRPALGEP